MDIFTTASLTFKYSLLSRMVSDCKYFLGYGNGAEKHLWGGTTEEHIESMKKLYSSIPDDLKPEWITNEQIKEIEMLMKNKMSQKAA